MNSKQRIFTAEYLKCLNATEAAIKAGYSPRCACVQGARLLRNAKIKEAINNSVNERENKLIADRVERQEVLTAIMRDTDESTKDRLRAIEILCRMDGDFISKSSLEIKATNSLTDFVLEA